MRLLRPMLPHGPRNRAAFSLLLLLLISSLLIAESPDSAPPSYQEIPYYLRKLAETDQDGKRFEFNKLIHDAIVNADISDKKTARRMAPTVDKVRAAIKAGLDRPYLEGKSMWLGSAIAYYDREKNRREISCPPDSWYGEQTVSRANSSISTFPDEILYLEGSSSRKLVENETGILEAVISSNGRRVAYSKKAGGKIEIWSVDTRKGKKKKIATLDSFLTLLFSLDGDHLFIQEGSERAEEESPVFRMSAGGGRLKGIGRVRLLESVVESGEFEGALVAYKDRPHHLGLIEQRCAYLIKSNGEEIGRVREIPCE